MTKTKAAKAKVTPIETTPPPAPDFEAERASTARPWYETTPEMIELIKLPWGPQHVDFLLPKLDQAKTVLFLLADHLLDVDKEARADFSCVAVSTEMAHALVKEACYLSIEKGFIGWGFLDQARAVLTVLDATLWDSGWVPKFEDTVMVKLYQAASDHIDRALQMLDSQPAAPDTSDSASGAAAFMRMFAAVKARADADLCDNEEMAALDTRNYRALSEIVLRSVRENLLNSRQTKHSEGYLRCLTDLFAILVDGACIGDDWHPLRSTAASWLTDSSDAQPGDRTALLKVLKAQGVAA